MQSRMPRRYRSSLRDAQARRTRQRVLDAATAVFLDRGYGGATIPAIAAVANGSGPTGVAPFGTKGRVREPPTGGGSTGQRRPVAVRCGGGGGGGGGEGGSWGEAGGGGGRKEGGVDAVWLLREPAVFERLTRRRGWTLEHYERWFSRPAARLLTADAPPQGNELPAQRSPGSTARGQG